VVGALGYAIGGEQGSSQGSRDLRLGWKQGRQADASLDAPHHTEVLPYATRNRELRLHADLAEQGVDA
jgi:hypothetical protein